MYFHTDLEGKRQGAECMGLCQENEPVQVCIVCLSVCLSDFKPFFNINQGMFAITFISLIKLPSANTGCPISSQCSIHIRQLLYIFRVLVNIY